MIIDLVNTSSDEEVIFISHPAALPRAFDSMSLEDDLTESDDDDRPSKRVKMGSATKRKRSRPITSSSPNPLTPTRKVQVLELAKISIPDEPTTGGGVRVALHSRASNKRISRRFPGDSPLKVLFAWAAGQESDCGTRLALILPDGTRLLSSHTELLNQPLDSIAGLSGSLLRALPIDDAGNVSLA